MIGIISRPRAARGVRTRWLGADTPEEEIATAAREGRARRLAVELHFEPLATDVHDVLHAPSGTRVQTVSTCAVWGNMS